MKTVEEVEHIGSDLPDELVQLFARQGKRVPVPVFLCSLLLASMAWNQLGGWLPWFWLSAVTLILAIRWMVLGSLPAAASSSDDKLRVAVLLSGINGIVQGASIGFAVPLDTPERAVHTIVLLGLCAGSVATTGGISACIRGVRRANDLAAEHHVGDRGAGRSTPVGGILHRGAHPRFRNGVAVACRRRIPPPQGILPDQAGPGGPQPATSSCARRRRGCQPRQDTLSGIGEPRPASTDAYDLAVQRRTGDAAAGQRDPHRSRFIWTRPCRH